MSTENNLSIIKLQFSILFYLEDPQPRSELSVTRVRGSVHLAISAGEQRSLSWGLQSTITVVRAEIKRTYVHNILKITRHSIIKHNIVPTQDCQRGVFYCLAHQHGFGRQRRIFFSTSLLSNSNTFFYPNLKWCQSI